MKAQMIAILILLGGLTACAGPQPTQTPDIPATVTAQVEAHLDSVPTATPLPTHTPYPTGTPYLTPTQVQTATFYPTAPPHRHATADVHALPYGYDVVYLHPLSNIGSAPDLHAASHGSTTANVHSISNPHPGESGNCDPKGGRIH